MDLPVRQPTEAGRQAPLSSVHVYFVLKTVVAVGGNKRCHGEMVVFLLRVRIQTNTVKVIYSTIKVVRRLKGFFPLVRRIHMVLEKMYVIG